MKRTVSPSFSFDSATFGEVESERDLGPMLLDFARKAAGKRRISKDARHVIADVFRDLADEIEDG